MSSVDSRDRNKGIGKNKSIERRDMFSQSRDASTNSEVYQEVKRIKSNVKELERRHLGKSEQVR